jgi:LysM repeat protein
MTMNNQNPLIPQGSALEQKNKGRVRVKIAVFFVLAIHGIGLLALLMQGCGQSKETIPAPEPPVTNTTPVFVETNTTPVTTNTVPVVVNPPPVIETPVVPVVPAGATEYTIAKGDNFSTLAKKFHVTSKAIADANPGVDSAKLKINQKIHIPAPVAPTAPTVTGTAPVETATAAGEQIYKVKSGDTLTKIASQSGTTIKALRALNNLKTDRLSVGQKLKIPAKASAPAAVPSAPLESAPTTPPTSTPTAPPGR